MSSGRTKPVNISGIPKEIVLEALYNAAMPRNGEAVPAITIEDARQVLVNNSRKVVGKLFGKILKVDLSGKAINPRQYDRYNGRGKCAEAVSRLRRRE